MLLQLEHLRWSLRDEERTDNSRETTPPCCVGSAHGEKHNPPSSVDRQGAPREREGVRLIGSDACVATIQTSHQRPRGRLRKPSDGMSVMNWGKTAVNCRRKHAIAETIVESEGQPMSKQNMVNAPQRRPQACAVPAEISEEGTMRATAAPALEEPTEASTPTSASARHSCPNGASSVMRHKTRLFSSEAYTRSWSTVRVWVYRGGALGSKTEPSASAINRSHHG